MNPFNSDEEEDIEATGFYKKEKKVDFPDLYLNQFLDFINKYTSTLNNFEMHDQIHFLKTNPISIKMFHKVKFKIKTKIYHFSLG